MSWINGRHFLVRVAIKPREEDPLRPQEVWLAVIDGERCHVADRASAERFPVRPAPHVVADWQNELVRHDPTVRPTVVMVTTTTVMSESLL